MRLASLAAVCILAGLAAADESPTVFHVSPDGGDQNSGSRDKPFATPARARDAIRALKAAQDGKLRGPVSVLFHGGTYPLDAPLVLTPPDSGTADAPIVYARAPGEKPVLSGGRRVAGWKDAVVDGKPLWAADLPDVRDGKWYFRQLWVNGRRAVRARGPNEGFHEVAGLPGPRPFGRGAAPGGPPRRFPLTAGADGKPSRFLVTMAGEGDREMVGDVWRNMYEVQPLNDPQGILQLEPGPDASGFVVVEATLRVIRHPRIVVGAVDVRAFTEYRLADAVRW